MSFNDLDSDLQYALNIASDDEKDNEEDEDYNSDDSTEKENVRYVILKEDDLFRRIKDDINKVSSVLSISSGDACMLLFKYSWS
jgi:hypothetical protein